MSSDSKSGQDAIRPSRRVSRLRMSLEDLTRHGMTPMTEKHYPEVLELYAEVFGAGKRDLLGQRFQRQYEDAPGRRSSDVTNWVLVRDDRVVGHFGFLLLRVKAGDQERIGTWAVDLFVHPDHRKGRGLAALLATLDHSGELPMGYGMAEVVFRSYLKRGYGGFKVKSHLIFPGRPWSALRLFDGGEGPWLKRNLQRCLKSVALFRQSRKMGSAVSDVSDTDSAIVEELDAAQISEAELDVFWSQLAPEYEFAVVRDAAYLNWRYNHLVDPARFLVSRRDGRVVALAVLEHFQRQGSRVLQISELLMPKVQRRRELPILMGRIFKVFRRLEADLLWTEALPDEIREILEDMGFVELDPDRREKMVYLDQNGDLDAAPADDSGGEWLFSAGDSDRSTGYARLPWNRHGA